jgi:flavin-binding protein dodecin
MPTHSYTIVELVGTSEHGIDQAIGNALTRAAETLRWLDWFEVVSIRGTIADGHVQQTQVTLKVGFRLEEPTERASRPAP